MKKRIKFLALVAFVISSTGCYTYQKYCEAYSYEEEVKNVETNEENS